MDATILGLTLLFGFAVATTMWLILAGLQQLKEETEETESELFQKSPLLKIALPFVQYFARALAPLRGLDRMRESLEYKLIRAGRIYVMTPDEVLGLMCVTFFVGIGFGLYVELFTGFFGPFGVVFCALFVGYMPVLNLSDAIKKRQKLVLKVLPYTLDLLCLSVEAGLDFAAALNRIGEKLGKNPFREEVRVLTQDIAMGKTRGEALRDMDERIGLDDLTSVVSALVQADELGASLGPTLRIQSSELQRKRFQRAEKKAMQAPVLMLIPLVLFIFPLVFIVIFAPMVIRYLTGEFGI
ncbi:MAG: type II secretion system F family protein [Planctomycetes bacterium]|nr:type II secretion system F family protein [Planctomycetota bacterium]